MKYFLSWSVYLMMCMYSSIYDLYTILCMYHHVIGHKLAIYSRVYLPNHLLVVGKYINNILHSFNRRFDLTAKQNRV